MILAHSVCFTLYDPSEVAKAKLVAACLEKLSGCEGRVYLAAGARAREFRRDANDQGYDVALLMGFRGRCRTFCR